MLSSFSDGGWVVVGGTSAGAPQWAGLLAIVGQGRSLAKKASLANAQVAVYGLRGDFHDITAGSNGFGAGPGYDFATGLGSPKADSLIPDLVNYVGSTALPPAFPPPSGPGSGAWWWLNTTPIHFTTDGSASAAAATVSTATVSPMAPFVTSIDTQTVSPPAMGGLGDETNLQPTGSNRSNDSIWLEAANGLDNGSGRFSRRNRLTTVLTGDVASSNADAFFEQLSADPCLAS